METTQLLALGLLAKHLVNVEGFQKLRQNFWGVLTIRIMYVHLSRLWRVDSRVHIYIYICEGGCVGLEMSTCSPFFWLRRSTLGKLPRENWILCASI